jgi:hypothetical protein
MKNPDIVIAIEPVVKAFEELGVAYYIGGSVASSACGIPRATLDVDIIADLKPPQVRHFAEKLQAEYFIDEEMILRAIRRKSSFNLVHLKTMLKVDIFVVREDAYHQEALKRKKKEMLGEEQTPKEFYFASPEDVILSKLEWFSKGDNVSERQWNDVLGVFKVQQKLLNLQYLRHWAEILGLTGLLEKSLHEAGIKK